MVQWAELHGKSAESVKSTYQGTLEQIREHETRHGYDKPWGPNGVTFVAGRRDVTASDGFEWGKQIFSYRDSPFPELAKPNAEVSAIKA